MTDGFRLEPIRSIRPKSLLKDFDCGVGQLNDYLSKYAAKNDALGIGKTFAATADGKIAGYFTLAAAQIAFEDVPAEYRKKLPKYPVPAMRIARLAVDKAFQGSGVGAWLLRGAFLKIMQVAEITGLYAVIVDAKEASKSFYEKYGFIRFQDKTLTYFIPMETVKSAVRSRA